MQIIDEMEPERRGFYAGAVGYFAADGGMDTCIALRTALVKDGKMYVQAGGGVVADSDSETEYQESRNKAPRLDPRPPRRRCSSPARGLNSTGPRRARPDRCPNPARLLRHQPVNTSRHPRPGQSRLETEPVRIPRATAAPAHG